MQLTNIVNPSENHQDVTEIRETCRNRGVLSLRLTHGDVGQLVSGAVRVDAVEVRTITVHSTQDQSRPDVALIPEQTHACNIRSSDV